MIIAAEKNITCSWVDLLSIEPTTRTTRLLARCVLDVDGVHCTGEALLVAELEAGVSSPNNAQRFTPRDGETFLQILSQVYRSVYLFATPVQRGNTVHDYALPAYRAIDVV